MHNIRLIAQLTRDDIRAQAQAAAERQDKQANPFAQGSLQHSQFHHDYERAADELAA